MKLVTFRNLSDPGGPGFSEGQVKALAATFSFSRESSDQRAAPDATVQCSEPTPPGPAPVCRPGRPSDAFPLPDPAAVAALGARPPDMSVLAKARTYERGFPLFLIDALTQFQEEGPDYIVALMQGYRDPPPGVTLSGSQSYNVYFPGHKIGMPPPLSDGQIDYTDGSPKTVKQYATDAAAFLSWAAEPKLENRKSLGLRVMIFLIVFAFLLYLCKNRIWAVAHGDEGRKRDDKGAAE